MIRYTEINAQYDSSFNRVMFMRFKSQFMADVLLGRKFEYGDIIPPKPEDSKKLQAYFWICYEGDVELTKAIEDKLTTDIFKHVKKWIKNEEMRVENEITDLNKVKDDVVECFAKHILNKKLKKIK